MRHSTPPAGARRATACRWTPPTNTVSARSSVLTSPKLAMPTCLPPRQSGLATRTSSLARKGAQRVRARRDGPGLARPVTAETARHAPADGPSRAHGELRRAETGTREVVAAEPAAEPLFITLLDADAMGVLRRRRTFASPVRLSRSSRAETPRRRLRSWNSPARRSPPSTSRRKRPALDQLHPASVSQPAGRRGADRSHGRWRQEAQRQAEPHVARSSSVDFNSPTRAPSRR